MLAGGSALALRLGHRFSEDLDWFISSKFDADALKAKLSALPEKPTVIEQNSPQTVRAYYDRLETSFISYQQVQSQTDVLKVKGSDIPVAKVELIAVMKAAAVHDRGKKRDFIDVHAICSQPDWSVSRFITHASRNIPLHPKQIALALTYFADAERDPMPEGCKVSWEKVKTDLSKWVLEWGRSLQRGR